ncbi:MAG TPA: hypothetical protein VII58_01800 [Acidobacteriaceae bacterium]
MTKRTFGFGLALGVVLLLCGAASGSAQVGGQCATGTIRGTVADPDGALVP